MDAERFVISNAQEKYADYIFSVEKEGEDWSLKPVEVITGTTDGNWTAISFLETPKPDSKFAYNNAYYLMAELKKGSAGHSH